VSILMVMCKAARMAGSTANGWRGTDPSTAAAAWRQGGTSMRLFAVNYIARPCTGGHCASCAAHVPSVAYQSVGPDLTAGLHGAGHKLTAIRMLLSLSSVLGQRQHQLLLPPVHIWTVTGWGPGPLGGACPGHGASASSGGSSSGFRSGCIEGALESMKGGGSFGAASRGKS